MALTFSFRELAALTGGSVVSGDEDAVLPRFAVDSRAVQEGDGFAALPGQKQDGHDFIAEAFRRGAAGVLVSRDVPGVPAAAPCLKVPDTLQALQAIAGAHRLKFEGRVVGITGTNGKTTVKEMLGRILASDRKNPFVTRGNLNSQVGLPLMLMELGLLHTHAVLEMGASEKGNIARLCALARPHVGVLTNVGKGHLEYFGNLEGVRAAKWELMQGLPKDGTAVLNADDGELMEMARGLKCAVRTFGMSGEADVRAENCAAGERTSFDLVWDGERRAVELPVPGLFNVSNALAAAAAAGVLGVPLSTVALALANFVPPPQRMQVIRRKDGVVFLVDAYNANPTSMTASLASFVETFPGRDLVAVLGAMMEMGPHAEPEHRALGEFLASLPLTRTFFIGEEGAWVQAGYAHKNGRGSLVVLQSTETLRREVERSLTPRTAVLFKASRGMKLEAVYGPLLTEKL